MILHILVALLTAAAIAGDLSPGRSADADPDAEPDDADLPRHDGLHTAGDEKGGLAGALAGLPADGSPG